MSCKGASKLTLTQALAIKANNYTSKDCKTDYEAFEVDARIIELQAKKDARENAMAIKAHERFEDAKQEIKDVKTLDDRIEAVTEIREYWKIYSDNGFSYQIIEIPPQILNF
jgi:cellobiose phosphorylase